MSQRSLTPAQQAAISELTARYPVGKQVSIRKEDPTIYCGRVGVVKGYIPTNKGAELFLHVEHDGEEFFVKVPATSVIAMVPLSALKR